MSQALQLIVVTLLVVCAALFAAWRLMSGTLRLRTIEALLRVLPGDPAQPGGQSTGLTGWLQALANRQRIATGCSACERNPAKRN
ncbi:MAG: hypothetical protein ABI645_10155 [Pseudomonadota bacterium]